MTSPTCTEAVSNPDVFVPSNPYRHLDRVHGSRMVPGVRNLRSGNPGLVSLDGYFHFSGLVGDTPLREL